jgi:AP-3 complex subunit beta
MHAEINTVAAHTNGGACLGRACLLWRHVWVHYVVCISINPSVRVSHSHDSLAPIAHTFSQIKKLVYVYLVRYAEEQQDVALLSISTFQKALKDPNQLIRGSALRVLSSIRVPIIAPILMLSIKEVGVLIEAHLGRRWW